MNGWTHSNSWLPSALAPLTEDLLFQRLQNVREEKVQLISLLCQGEVGYANTWWYYLRDSDSGRTSGVLIYEIMANSSYLWYWNTGNETNSIACHHLLWLLLAVHAQYHLYRYSSYSKSGTRIRQVTYEIPHIAKPKLTSTILAYISIHLHIHVPITSNACSVSVVGQWTSEAFVLLTILLLVIIDWIVL